MRKQRHGADRSVGPVQQRGECVTLGVAEIEFYGGQKRFLLRLSAILGTIADHEEPHSEEKSLNRSYRDIR